MKFIVTADIHAHKFKEFDRHTDLSGSYRLDMILLTLQSMMDYCYLNGIGNIVIAGDLFNVRGKVDIEVQNSVYDLLAKAGDYHVNILMIPGNHDQVDNSDNPSHSLHTFRDLPCVTVIDTEGVYTLVDGVEEFNLVLLPYNKDAQRIKDFVSMLILDKDFEPDRAAIIFHLGISGGFQGNSSYPLAEAFNLEDLYPEEFRYVIGGHFHKRQFLGGTNNALYVGAPIQHSFNDEGEDKGFYIFDTNKKCDISFVPIPNPQFRTITSETPEEDVLKYQSNGDYLRVQLKEHEVEEFLANVPQDTNYKIELQKEYIEDTRVNVKVGMSFEQIIKEYAEEFNPDATDVGLRILSEVGGERA